MTDIRQFNTALQVNTMSNVVPLHIMDDLRDYREKVARCDELAGSYFADATKAQKAEFDAEMKSLLGVTGPRWDRARDAAKAKFKASTVEAAALCDRTFEYLMATGEVSTELDNEWTALIEREALLNAMVEAAE